MESRMAETDTDIAAIYDKIGELETTDETLKAKIDEIEGGLKKSVEQNMADIKNQFDTMNNQIYQVEIEIGDARTQIADAQAQIGDAKTEISALRTLVENALTKIEEVQNYIESLSVNALKYRYEADTNTLYLLP